MEPHHKVTIILEDGGAEAIGGLQPVTSHQLLPSMQPP